MEFADDRLLTSHQAGALLQVNPSSISNWVRAGRIAAHRTPGGHIRIRVRDLVTFLERHEMPIPETLSGTTTSRLLIVDDDRRQLKSLRRRLKPYQDQVVVELVDNGIDALLRVGTFKPDLIVLDIFMPQVDGLAVTQRLKLNPQTRDIDIIVASGHLTSELQAKALEAGAKHCVPKPVQLELILGDLGISSKRRKS